MPSKTTQALTGLIQGGLVLLILWTPLPFASVGADAVFGIELFALLLGLAAWLVVVLDREAFPRGARAALLPALGILLIGAIQLLPLGSGWSATVAPRVHEARELVHQAVQIQPPLRSSLTPATGIDAVARFGAYVGLAFAAAVGLRTRRSLQVIALAFVAAAVFQGLYGAFESISGRNHILGYPKQHYVGDATGTFVNRNHYAVYLAMAMPMALALLAAPLPKVQFQDWRHRLLRLAEPRLVFGGLLLAGLGCMWIGIVLSYSRAGMAVALVATAFSAWRLWRKRWTVWVVAAALAVPTLFLLYQDVRTPGERLSDLTADAVSDTGRLPVWKATAAMAADHWVIGTGFGSFDGAFPLYRPASTHMRWQHAHNDWLQAASEGGVVTLLLFLAIGWPVVRRREEPEAGRMVRAIRLAALAGVVAVALHALVDFPVRIPAVAVILAILIGIRCGKIEHQDAPRERA